MEKPQSHGSFLVGECRRLMAGIESLRVKKWLEL